MRHDGAAGEVGVEVEADVDAVGVGLFDAIEGGLWLAPVRTAYCLEVGDLEAAAGAAGEFDLLLHRLDEFEGVAAHVAGVQPIMAGDDAAESFQFCKGGLRSGSVHEAGGKADCAFRECFVQLGFHLVEMDEVRGGCLVAADGGAEGSVADQGFDMDEARALANFGEVGGVAPALRPVQDSFVLLGEQGRVAVMEPRDIASASFAGMYICSCMGAS